MRRFIKTALLGLSILCGSFTTATIAQTLEIVRKGSERDLNITMNRAIVVESDVPFADLSVANPGIADIVSLSDRTIYVLGKTPGRTTLTLLTETGQLIANVELHVSTDVSEFKERLGQILPGEEIDVRSANDGIVLSGRVSSITKMNRALELAERYAPERVSNLMNVVGNQQVQLKVRFAEMSRSVSKALSTSFFANGNNSSVETGTTIANTTFPIAVDSGASQGVAFLGFDIGSVELGVLIEALETKGAVRTLAEPNLTALSGQEAKFLAGGEFPVPVAQDNDTTTIEFRPFGVELNFIPRVLDDNIINLEVATAVSALDPAAGIIADGLTIPGFSRRDASTTVSMRDGESFAIAGLLQDDFLDNNSQVPFLGDVPILGTLFRSANFERSQTELVIIISAHLVSPTTGEALALPTDRIRPPSEADLFLRGRVTGRPVSGTPQGEVARQDFSGSYGYVLD